MTLGQLKQFLASVPDEYDGVQLNWLDFSGYEWPRLRIYADGAIIDGTDEDDKDNIQDRRPLNWR